MALLAVRPDRCVCLFLQHVRRNAMEQINDALSDPKVRAAFMAEMREDKAKDDAERLARLEKREGQAVLRASIKRANADVALELRSRPHQQRIGYGNTARNR